MSVADMSAFLFLVLALPDGEMVKWFMEIGEIDR